MDCIKFSETKKGEVRKTARKAYEKIFAGTEKGEVRKTARRAYEKIPYDEILDGIKQFRKEWTKSAREGVPDSFRLTEAEKATLMRASRLIMSRSAF